MDHLHSLNLAGIWQKGNQKATYDEKTQQQTGVEINSLAQLSSFGQLFAKACIPNDIKKYV